MCIIYPAKQATIPARLKLQSTVRYVHKYITATCFHHLNIAVRVHYTAVPSVCTQLTPVGTTIFQSVHAKDVDAGVNGLVEYFIVPGDGKGLGTDDGVGRNRINAADGVGYFSINLPHQGQVTVNRSLDFERTQRYLVTIVASVRTTILLCYKSM